MAPRKTPSRGGKPDKLMRDALLLELSAEAKRAGGKPTKRLRLVARKLVDCAEKGDVSAIKEIFDRVDGRVPQAQVLEPEPVNILHELLQSVAKTTHILPSDDVDDPFHRYPLGDTITLVDQKTGAVATMTESPGHVTNVTLSAGVATSDAKAPPADAPRAPVTNGHGSNGAAERYGLTMPRMKSLLPDLAEWSDQPVSEAVEPAPAARQLKSLI
jgi:hypothetical protein